MVVAERKLTLGDASVNAPTNDKLQAKESMPHSKRAQGLLRPGLPITVSFQRATALATEARHWTPTINNLLN